MNNGSKVAMCLLVIGINAPGVLAHKFSTAYMDVKDVAGQPAVVWKVALHDLAQAGLIASANSHQVSWQQVTDSAPALNTYLNDHISFSSAGEPCQINAALAADWQLQRLHRDSYLLLPLVVSCKHAAGWQLTYRALFAGEPSHKLLLSWQVAGASDNAVLAADAITYPEQPLLSQGQQ
ncbi:hypothetical protein [Arsukibacterium sp.]|uniref:hypothetical protein n=1 Tax=Arsukibacterium sp. TaxID=1977258 RepID=UPI00299D10DC|nr:hypothetical protein [Arsukibacterium sp.]MDX1538068.1 hypothetical protein [Arsukibacterium sp.]